MAADSKSKWLEPSSVIGSVCLACTVFVGSMILEVPNRITNLEASNLLLAYRVGELEKVVNRDNQTVVKK